MPNDLAARKFHAQWRAFMVATGYADHVARNPRIPERFCGLDDYGAAECLDCDERWLRHHTEMVDWAALSQEAQERRIHAVESPVLNTLTSGIGTLSADGLIFLGAYSAGVPMTGEPAAALIREVAEIRRRYEGTQEEGVGA